MEKKAYCPAISEDVQYFGAKEVVAAEWESIRQRRGLPDSAVLKAQDLCGLSLSGGGIRSASFSLGIMQALAHNGWLEKIDYLSTVSGGGYIGSCLTWTLNSDPGTFGLKESNFPFASFPMSGEARDAHRTSLDEQLEARSGMNRWSGRLLNFLRQNAKYLTPGKGLNLVALMWVALRGAAMGLLVYGALITLFFLFAFHLGLLRKDPAFSSLSEVLLQNWLLLAAVTGFGIWMATIPLYSLTTYLYRCWKLQCSYRLRRIYERTAGRLLPVLMTLLLLGIIPWAHDWVKTQGDAAQMSKGGQFKVSGNLTAEGDLSFQGTMHSTAKAKEQPVLPVAPKGLWGNIINEVYSLGIGFVAVLVGFFSGIKSFLKTMSAKPGKVPQGLLVTLGVAALLFGIVLFAYTVAYAMVHTPGYYTLEALITFSLITLALAIFTNLNHISIHRYYRDRLMETFMPDVDKVLAGKYRASQSNRANTEPLQAMTHGPYHIVNTNLVLVSSEKPKFRGRGGDNFILSPLYCGSYATGWQGTDSFMKGAMTLASAMATSGAAMNPSAGCGGEGITRSPLLSVLMGLLNFRLGYWVSNPKYWQTWRGGVRNPNFLLPGLWEVLLRNRLTEEGVFLQLSDGGHFENLALYEMVRRKLRLIIVCDGGADPEFTFSDLANAMEKVRADFGALIMIDNEELQRLIPKKGDDPGSVACAERGYLVAPIKYADNSEGTLIYLTTTFFKGVTADLYGYKKEHPAFPDEPTSDQFFDEKQFEAYRELGFQAAWKMMQDGEVVRCAWPNGVPT